MKKERLRNSAMSGDVSIRTQTFRQHQGKQWNTKVCCSNSGCLGNVSMGKDNVSCKESPSTLSRRYACDSSVNVTPCPFWTSLMYLRTLTCVVSGAVVKTFLKISTHFYLELGLPKWLMSSFCTFSWFHDVVFLTLNLLTPIHFALTLALTGKWLCFILS